jgi:putative ABC transport system ATP-binding protein
MSLVALQKVCKIYGGEGVPVYALREVDFEIDQGDFVCLAGPSGSGKTTLLNMLGCLDRPSSGKVIINGISTGKMSRGQLADLRRRTFGFVFQSFNLLPVLSAAENVEYVLMLQGLAQKERERRVSEAMEAVGLADVRSKRPGQLSGGQQRVAVARAIVGRPEVVLADEPTANLDSKTGEGLINLLLQLNRQRLTTFVLSSHDPSVSERAHRIIDLRDGSIVNRQSR